MARTNSHFQPGSGVYTCTACGKRTRATGACEEDCGLCCFCFEEAGVENEHSDEAHGGDFKSCPICQQVLKDITGETSAEHAAATRKA